MINLFIKIGEIGQIILDFDKNFIIIITIIFYGFEQISNRKNTI